MRTAVLLLLLSVVGVALSAPVCPAKCLQNCDDNVSQSLHKRLSTDEEEAPFQKRCDLGYCIQGCIKTFCCMFMCCGAREGGLETQATKPITKVSMLAVRLFAHSPALLTLSLLM